MNQKKTVLTILFADIAKSSRLYEVLGDTSAQELISHILSVLSKVAVKNDGTVVKTIGDEVMCTFLNPNKAVDAARGMHESLERLTLPGRPAFRPPNIYVGLHMGPVVSKEDDVFGDAVNVAARMVTLAKPRQILTTKETVDHLNPDQKNSAQWVDKTTVKGKSGEIKIFEVVWEGQDKTVMVDSLLESQTLRFHLVLMSPGQTVEVDQNRPSATLGRQSHNDMVVNDSRVSRSHARVEYRRGRFVLVDQSSNGTFVAPKGGKGVKIKRDEFVLSGEGLIALGHTPEPDAPDTIRYRITS